ncbi:MAG: MoxR family ATPase [Actinobacteria bacterium]|jgi:MoxR-like ATPase|nr:MAG: ATPase [Acidimicrobium sp. BACL17 MAG-120823-bin42]MDA0192943.1 MoxR family ATPase [Actinomycetota bacterium]MDA2952713.1 MoxR family ATPase [Actinomycetota bacterium]MDA2999438.1 MoxR family ATPase [Actinomycetota bacterium]
MAATSASDVLIASTASVVGRKRELELVVAALHGGRHVLLEGPPGTGKSTLLRSVAEAMGVGFAFVEGNAELTPARLVGHFDPARVLTDGYSADVFVDGPLVSALRDGSLLYVEEINRIPEETLNVLITVMSEGEITVPRLGTVKSSAGFRLVAAMNPFDAVGTARISSAVYDRVCRIAMTYQHAEDEIEIVQRELHQRNSAISVPSDWVAQVVEMVRRTRNHADLRFGSSVRGAIDTAVVATSLAAMRKTAVHDPTIGLDSALVALTGRVRLREGSVRTAEEVITEIFSDVFGVKPEDGDAGKAGAPTGATNSRL